VAVPFPKVEAALSNVRSPELSVIAAYGRSWSGSRRMVSDDALRRLGSPKGCSGMPRSGRCGEDERTVENPNCLPGGFKVHSRSQACLRELFSAALSDSRA
jgi:hypothetical protein